MGQRNEHRCLACGERFEVDEGGGFFSDLLHCDSCGQAKSISHEEMGNIHLGYITGLPGPYAVGRTDMDEHIRETYYGAGAHGGGVRVRGRGSHGPVRVRWRLPIRGIGTLPPLRLDQGAVERTHRAPLL